MGIHKDRAKGASDGDLNELSPKEIAVGFRTFLGKVLVRCGNNI